MQRRAIEFHDSELLWVRPDGRCLRIRMSAYVHASEGEPGRDPGTGWKQDVDFLLGEARLEVPPPHEPMFIADGRLTIRDRVLEGILSLPFSDTGEMTLELEGVGGNLRVTAQSVSVAEAGKARFIEHFPGTP